MIFFQHGSLLYPRTSLRDAKINVTVWSIADKVNMFLPLKKRFLEPKIFFLKSLCLSYADVSVAYSGLLWLRSPIILSPVVSWTAAKLLRNHGDRDSYLCLHPSMYLLIQHPLVRLLGERSLKLAPSSLVGFSSTHLGTRSHSSLTTLVLVNSSRESLYFWTRMELAFKAASSK